jgi:hypothetical protein
MSCPLYPLEALGQWGSGFGSSACQQARIANCPSRPIHAGSDGGNNPICGKAGPGRRRSGTGRRLEPALESGDRTADFLSAVPCSELHIRRSRRLPADAQLNNSDCRSQHKSANRSDSRRGQPDAFAMYPDIDVQDTPSSPVCNGRQGFSRGLFVAGERTMF